MKLRLCLRLCASRLATTWWQCLKGILRDAPDHALNKMNALDLAAREGVGEERVIAAFLNAVGLGNFKDVTERHVPKLRGGALRQ